MAVNSETHNAPYFAIVVRFFTTWFDGVRHELAVVRWLSNQGFEPQSGLPILRTSNSPSTVDIIPVKAIIRPIAIVPVAKMNSSAPNSPTFYYLNKFQAKDLLMYVRKLVCLGGL